MAVLTYQQIKAACLNKPLNPLICPWSERTISHGATFGLSAAGYDVRIKQDVWLWHGRFVLASTIEKVMIPNNVVAVVHDKSTHARRGLSVFNTIIDPGFSGWVTLELAMHGWGVHFIRAGTPIAQIVFHQLETATAMPYQGKYQNQPDRPVPAIAA